LPIQPRVKPVSSECQRHTTLKLMQQCLIRKHYVTHNIAPSVQIVLTQHTKTLQFEYILHRSYIS